MNQYLRFSFLVPAMLTVVVGGIAALFALGWGFNWHVTNYADGHIYDDVAHISSQQVAIVLGARVTADGKPYPALEDRLHCGLELYRAGKIERILVSGDHGQHTYDEVNGMQGWLLDQGVSVDDVFLDHAGFRTFETMHRAADVFDVEDAVVCTQQFHQARAVFLARRAGIDAVGLEADRRVYLDAGANGRREFLARSRAVLDSYLPFIRPHYRGGHYPITGDARLTHDERTRLE